MAEHSQPQQAWGGFGKSTSPSWCHLELPGLSIPWWHSLILDTQKEIPSVCGWFSPLLAGFRMFFCNILTAEGN